MKILGLATVGIVCAVTLATASHAAGTPEQQCQATKNKTAGTYAACRQSAAAKLATSGNVAKYSEALGKCATKFASAWQKAIDKASKKGVDCPDAPLRADQFQSVIDQHTNNVTTALKGEGLGDVAAEVATCNGNLTSCEADLTVCDDDLSTCDGDLTQCQDALATCQAAPVCGDGTIEEAEECEGGNNLNGETCKTQGFAGGTLRCAAGCTFDTNGCYAARFVDNGDGTVTDRQTGLQWEKKDSANGSQGSASPHDVDNRYTWNSTVGGTAPNGTAFSDFLAMLNGADDGICFVNKCDWRLPTVEELQTILLEPYPCGTIPCIESVFGPTVAGGYWSSSTLAVSPGLAWGVDFNGGFVGYTLKDNTLNVRAVRAGS